MNPSRDSIRDMKATGSPALLLCCFRVPRSFPGLCDAICRACKHNVATSESYACLWCWKLHRERAQAPATCFIQHHALCTEASYPQFASCAFWHRAAKCIEAQNLQALQGGPSRYVFQDISLFAVAITIVLQAKTGVVTTCLIQHSNGTHALRNQIMYEFSARSEHI